MANVERLLSLSLGQEIRRNNQWENKEAGYQSAVQEGWR